MYRAGTIGEGEGDVVDTGFGAVLDAIIGGAAAVTSVLEHRAAKLATVIETKELVGDGLAGYAEMSQAGRGARQDPAVWRRWDGVGQGIIGIDDEAVVPDCDIGKGEVARGGGGGNGL